VKIGLRRVAHAGADAGTLAEAAASFKTAIVPHRLRKGEPWPTEIDTIEARALHQALELAFGSRRELPKGKKVA
jgi:hypothetical protein